MRAPLTPMQRVEAFFHLTPHFAYPLMVLLSVLLLPALVLMPATQPEDDAHDRPAARHRHDRLARGVLRDGRGGARAARRSARSGRLPALLALGAGLAPHLTKAVWEGLRSMSGEFVRTPKKGMLQGRYRAAADLPIDRESPSASSPGASTIASLETRPLVRDAVRDALHLRLRVRRVLRRHRAARARKARPAAAGRGAGALVRGAGHRIAAAVPIWDSMGRGVGAAAIRRDRDTGGAFRGARCGETGSCPRAMQAHAPAYRIAGLCRDRQ